MKRVLDFGGIEELSSFAEESYLDEEVVAHPRLREDAHGGSEELEGFPQFL